MPSEKKSKVMEAFLQKWEALKDYYTLTGISLSFEMYLATFVVLATLTSFILAVLKLNLLTTIVAFVSIVSFIILIPVNLRDKRITQIDENLPEALKYMALVLKAGGTTETAFAEASNAGYGPVSTEFKTALKQLREGKNFDDVLRDAANRSGSILFQRTALIIIDAKKAGAGIADVMTQIAEDARDVAHIRRERHSRTTIHVIFLLSSSLVLAPFIFGFSIGIVNYINQGIASAVPDAKTGGLCDLSTMLTFFIMLQSVICSLAIGLIREGKMYKYAVYTPIMVLVSLLIFEAGKWISALIIGGGGITC